MTRSLTLSRAATLAHPRTARALLAEARARPAGDAEHLDAVMRWIARAHDATGRGGVSARYDLAAGWDPPYPETTGYIIGTCLHYARIADATEFADRAIAMGSWLLSVQAQDGYIPGGLARTDGSGRPEVFNTGQVLFGWLALLEHTGDARFGAAAERAAAWLASVQDPDGAWTRFSLHGVPHSYYRGVAWALARAGRVLGDERVTRAAVRSLDWTCARQRDNAWIDHMSFTEGSDPLTHTIAYTIEGLLECALCLDRALLEAAVGATTALEVAYRDERSGARRARNGGLAATFGSDWVASSGYECLTGSAQVALCCRRLDEVDPAPPLAGFADDLISAVKEAHPLTGPDGIRGGVSGSFPLWGAYGSFKFLNWAAKFVADVLMDRLAGALPRDRFG